MQRLIAPSVDRECFRIGFSRCRHWCQIDTFNNKRIFAPAKDRTHSIDHLRFRTPILPQCITTIRDLCRFQISKNVRPPKSINRLLGIADEKYGGVATAINLRENRILDRIGVLKFIH